MGVAMYVACKTHFQHIGTCETENLMVKGLKSYHLDITRYHRVISDLLPYTLL